MVVVVAVVVVGSLARKLMIDETLAVASVASQTLAV